VVICPNCHAENRSGAKFCKSCATRLPVSSPVTRPLGFDPTADPKATLAFSAALNGSPDNNQATRRMASSARSGTRPLNSPDAFGPRPVGAIFGDTFLYENLVFSDEHQHRYSVRQVNVSDDLQIRVCPNPDCGAVFPPRSTAPEKFCTDCGKTLERGGKDLVLIESKAPIPEAIVRVAAKGLSHGGVRAPLATFVERLGGLPRHCMIVNRIGPLEAPADALQAMQWGIRLARGMDYLHDNGVTFNGQAELSCLGMATGGPVWANFLCCQHHPDGYVSERQADARALALLIFQWLTGQATYTPHTNLSPAVQAAFDAALGASGLESGLALADALDQAAVELSLPQAVDFEVGRASNVGRVRTLNEDSLLCVEINRIQQSVSRPLGVFVVADGMGGHTAGEIASSTIVNVIAQRAFQDLLPGQISQSPGQESERWLRQAVEAANHQVYTLRKSAGTDMGSTLVAATLEGNRACVAHVGDSRAYRVTPAAIQRLTIDHSLVERLVANRQITREEARHHPQRNVIYRTVGDKANVEVEVGVHMLSVGDWLVLCSDGLVGPVEDETIARLVREAASPQAACEALIQAANDGGGEDNISVIVVKIIQP